MTKLRKIIVIVLATLIVAPTMASAQTDVSVWAGVPQKEDVFFFPWLIHSMDEGMIDARYAFDAPGTAGLFVGPNVALEGIEGSILAGVLFGEYNAYSVEVYAGGEFAAPVLDTISIFTQTQYALGEGEDADDNEQIDFAFHFGEATASIGEYLDLGIAWQWWKNTSASDLAAIDLGGVVKVTKGNFYLKSLPFLTVNQLQPNGQDRQFKIMTGLGFNF